MDYLVDKCVNKDHQGNGVYLMARTEHEGDKKLWVCMPCWYAVTG